MAAFNFIAGFVRLGMGARTYLAKAWLVIFPIMAMAALAQYYQNLDAQEVSHGDLGRGGNNAVFAGLGVCTTVLLFRHSRNFPRFFILQMFGVIFDPLIDLLWVASMISFATNEPNSKYLSLEPREGGAIIAGMIGAAMWIPYVLRSRRVANTFRH